jgi:C-terminal peptidase prc
MGHVVDVTLLLAILLAAPSRAQAPAPHESYATAVRLVDNLFLEPETVDAQRLLRAAAQGLSNDIPWLFVAEDDDGTLRFSHGSGAPLGAAKATTIEALPAQLQQIEGLITGSGHPLPAHFDVRLALLEGLTGALDRYSRVLSGDGLSRFDTRLKGTLVGIGASFALHNEALVVTRVDPTGPAERGGLRVGDELLRVDGRSTVNMPMSDLMDRVQGGEGVPLALTIRRASDTLSVSLIRSEVVVPNVTHRVLDNRVGYIQIDHISQRTVENLRASLQELREADGLSVGLVLDLRGNTGGSMKESARAADQFLTSGVLLRTVGHDGGRVQNLEAEMNAVDADDEPEIPVVILVDRRTASGSEIIAGALLEGGRTALVGTNTYGKGTVQKIYTLDADKRLKLTVARYVLANDRRISTAGISPDVRIGEIDVDPLGMHLNVSSLTDPMGVLLVRDGGSLSSDDPALELARRAVLRATGTTDRASLVKALAFEAVMSRQQEEQRLSDALSAQGIDWSPATDEASFPDVTASFRTAPSVGATVPVEVSVTNDGAEPIHRAFVALSCDTFSAFDDVVVPLGRLEPGQTVKRVATARLPQGTEERVDTVRAVLHSHLRPPIELPSAAASAHAFLEPKLSVSARLVPHMPGGKQALGPHGHPVYRTELSIAHDSKGALTGVEVYFRTPDDDRIELIDRGARHPRIGPQTSERFDLTVEVAPTLTEALPLELRVDTERFGRLAEWTFDLPQDGSLVHLEVPHVTALMMPKEAPEGPLSLDLRVEDDELLGDTTLWVNGRKTDWYAGGDKRIKIAPTVQLRSGTNRITVWTVDNRGLDTRRTFTVNTEAPSTADADAP